jgi:hypothetical protein
MPNKDGSLRRCGDYHYLNAITVQPCHLRYKTFLLPPGGQAVPAVD